MGEARELQLQIMGQEAREENSAEGNVVLQTMTPRIRKYMWWLQIAIYSLFVLSGQTVATLLGRLYFEKGGKSKWLATLVQLAGFPILLPLYCLSLPKSPRTSDSHTSQPSALVLLLLYVSLGILLAGDCMMYSVGLSYLPVSTYSLICATQLAFNAFFSFFLNSQKFTPFIVNSLVLLTTSSTLLVFQTGDSSDPKRVAKGKYIIGFLCTLCASAGSGLALSLIQLSFQKILKRETYTVILDLIIYQSLVATCVAMVGLFASGDWKSLNREMGDFELGKVSYLMILLWTAVGWAVFSVGLFGLIFEVSSLFSNVISTLGLPIVPVLAVVFFHDKMDGVKVIAMFSGSQRKKLNGEGKSQQSTVPHIQGYMRWFQMAIYSLSVLSGQGTLLGRLCFNEGNCMMYLVGQSHPVFTFSLINATQLALMHSSPFSSIHRSSLTPFIVNSLVLLTVSSTILFQPDHEKSLDHEKSYKKKCIIGFLCTVCASSGYGLTLSLIQLAFKKILREIL
ncbi:Purine permease 21 [Vitis vinifera]|uniref:Probable purine permease n=1 Tax=Vitis vinifera TaxID=29760 RepID=A0A438JP37_VITVI|nr:Purine permease 21 [Vitis vinifera]